MTADFAVRLIVLANHAGNNAYAVLSSIGISGQTATGGRAVIMDARAANWDTIFIDEVIVIDLTKLLPAALLALTDANLKTWCDANIPAWFDGTLSGGRIGGIGGLH